MKSLFYVFIVVFTASIRSFPEEVTQLRQKLNETLDEDDLIQNQLHQIELSLIMLNMEMNRYKFNGSVPVYTGDDQISPENEDGAQNKVLKAIDSLEYEKSQLKEKLLRLDKKKTKIKRILKSKSTRYFKYIILTGAVVLFICFLGLIVIFLMYPCSNSTNYQVVNALHKTLIGIIGGTFLEALKVYLNFENKTKSMK